MIQRFEQRNPSGLAIYHGWDYRIEVSGPYAIDCGADVLLLGGVDTNEFLRFLFHCLNEKRSGALAHASLLGYEELLRSHCHDSGFWSGAEALRKSKLPPSPYW